MSSPSPILKTVLILALISIIGAHVAAVCGAFYVHPVFGWFTLSGLLLWNARVLHKTYTHFNKP